MSAIGSLLGLVSRLGSKVPAGWSKTTFQSLRNYFTKKPSLSTALVPYTGGSSAGVFGFIRENKVASIFILYEVLGAVEFAEMITEVFGDTDEAAQILGLMAELNGKFDDPGRGKTSIDFAKMSDEFQTINKVLNFTSFTLDEIVALRAVLAMAPGVFEQYMLFTEQARSLRV